MKSDYSKVQENNKSNCPVIQIVEAEQTRISNQKKDKFGTDKVLCILYLSLIICFSALLVVGMWYETEYMIELIDYLSDMIKNAVNSSNWPLSYSIYFLAQVGFHLFFLPGLTFWNGLIGYYMNSLTEAFLVVYIPSVISCFLTYVVVRFIFKKWCLGMCMKKRVFRAFLKESRDKPWKTSSLVRLMFIPVATKNYMMPLLEINFLQYAIPAAIFYIPYLGAMVLVGRNLNDFKKVTGDDGWKDMNGFEKFQFCFTTILGTVTVFLCIWFAWITCKKMKELNAQEKEFENKEKLEEEGQVNKSHLDENGQKDVLTGSDNMETQA